VPTLAPGASAGEYSWLKIVGRQLNKSAQNFKTLSKAAHFPHAYALPGQFMAELRGSL